MSDINASEWSEKTVAALRVQEANCADSDLFCVGYLIPQVELVEMVHADREGTAAEWHDVYSLYVEQSMAEDSMQSDDVSKVREILKTLI